MEPASMAGLHLRAVLSHQHAALEKALGLNRWIAQRMSQQDDELGAADLMPVAMESQSPSCSRSCNDELNSGLGLELAPEVLHSEPERPVVQRHHLRIANRRIERTQENGGDLSEPLLGAEESSHPRQISSLSDVERPNARRTTHRVFQGVSETQKIVEKTLAVKPKALDEYADDGFWPSVVRAKSFHNIVMTVIVANTIWIGVDTDYNHADSFSDAPLVFQAADSFFCAFFLLEIVARLLAFPTWRKAFINSSFLFDLTLVVVMIWQSWLDLLLSFFDCGVEGSGGRTASILRILRLFRLTRVARLSRVLSVVPELEILSKGMFAALRGMLVTLSMLLIVIYVFAILFVQMLAGTPIASGHFESVLQSMNFMLLQVLCGFDASFFKALAQTGWIYYFMWLALLLVASLVLMNMLIGILVEMVSTITEADKDAAALLELTAEVEQLDSDGNRIVSKDELGQITANPAVTTKLAELGVDVAAFVEFAQFIFQDEGEMEISDFVHLAVQFRGDKHSTVKDVVDLRKFVTMEVNHIVALLSNRLQGIENLVVEGVRTI